MLDDLIQQAADLKAESYRSPPVKLWKRRAQAFIESEYGPDFVDIFDRVVRFRRVIRSDAEGDALHRSAMDDAIVFLEGLRAEHPSTPPPEGPSVALHPTIHNGCMPLFEDGHFAEAVERSYKIVRDRLRALTGFETGSEAFGKGKLRIAGAAAAHVADDFNEGVKFLTMAIDKFRNEKSHSSDGHIHDPERAREYIALSSLAMHLLEQAETPE